MKKVGMNISHICFILFNLKLFGEIVITKIFMLWREQIGLKTFLLSDMRR